MRNSIGIKMPGERAMLTAESATRSASESGCGDNRDGQVEAVRVGGAAVIVAEGVLRYY
jgi:hypothetical protein